MDRSDFLKIVSATPFAIKSLILSDGKEEIEKMADVDLVRSMNDNHFLFKIDGEEIGITRNATLSVNNDIQHERVIHRSFEVSFDDLRVIDGVDLESFLFDRKLISVEMYRKDNAMFITVDGYLSEIEHNHLNDMYSGVIFSETARVENL